MSTMRLTAARPTALLALSLCKSARAFATPPLVSTGDVAVGTPARDTDRPRAAALAERIQCPLVDYDGEGTNLNNSKSTNNLKFVLAYDAHGRLGLCAVGSGLPPLAVDFLGGKMGYRAAQQQQAAGELVVKAVRSSGREPPLVWDLTAGLGRDSFVLAGAGCRVVMFERSAVVGALLEDGLQRLRGATDEDTCAVASRLQLRVTDSCGLLVSEDGAQERPDVCLVDPMFPAKKKKALVKKDMQVLQRLFDEGAANSRTNTDGDAADLFAAAATLAKVKVVVKRPIKGELLVPALKPTTVLLGRSNRFDVYAAGPVLAKAAAGA